MKLFRKKKKPVHNENWRIWDFYDDEDRYGLITYDITYLSSTSSYPCNAEFLLDISIPAHLTTDGFFPSPDGQQALIQMEDQLISLLETKRVNCLQVIRLTHNGKRTFVFEVIDVVPFLESMKMWTKSVRGFEFNIEKYDAWTYYKEWEPDQYNWQQIGNGQVIEKMIEHGSDPEKIHKLECSFIGPPSELIQLKQKFIAEGGTLLLEEDDLLEIEFEMPLDHQEIDPLTFFLMDEAQSLGCKFDGWRAALVK